MTTEQKLKAVLAYLDDILAKDAARTQGDWIITEGGSKCFGHGDYRDTGAVRADSDTTIEVSNYFSRNIYEDAAFIAGASVWSAPMAKALKEMIRLLEAVANNGPGSVYGPGPRRDAGIQIAVLLNYFPDEIVKPFNKNEN